MNIVLASDAVRSALFELDDGELQAIAQSASLTALREAAESGVRVFGETAEGRLVHADADDLLLEAEDQEVIQTCGQIGDSLRAMDHDVVTLSLDDLEQRQIAPGDCDMLIVDVNARSPSDLPLARIFGHLAPTFVVAKHDVIRTIVEAGAQAGGAMYLGFAGKPLAESTLRSVVRAVQEHDLDRFVRGRRSAVV
jgi:hypothetical protein